MALDADSIQGSYEVLSHLGEGGMGLVYKVRHRRLDEIRVIKMIRAEVQVSEMVVRRFEREAKMMIELDHPNVAHAFDASIEKDGTTFLVMEYIDGVTLKEMVTEAGAPSLGLAAEIGCQGLEAIAFIHEQGIIHRDIASDNLMVQQGPDGEPIVKLIDLGIAKAESSTSRQLTQAGSFLGKARYTAPEQFAAGGAVNLDRRSDVYSFGVLLYELLTGRCPIGGSNFTEVLSFHLFLPPLDFAESDPEGKVPEELRRLVLQALEKKAEERIESAAAFLEALQAFRQPGSYREELAALLAKVGRSTAPVERSAESETAEIAERIARIFRETDEEESPQSSTGIVDVDAADLKEEAARELVAVELMATARYEALDPPTSEDSGLSESTEQAEPPPSERPTLGSAVPDFVIREQSLEAVEEKAKGVQPADGLEPSDESGQQQGKSSCLLWLVIALMVLLSLVLLRTASGKTPAGARPTSQGESTQPGTCDERPMVH